MSVQIPWSPGAKYIKITCRIGSPVQDGADVDQNPDLVTSAGTVRLTCSAKRMKYVESDGRSRMLSTRDWLFDIRSDDGELVSYDGTVGVYVLSPFTQGLIPKDFFWKAVVTPLQGDPWEAYVPAKDITSFDLVDAGLLIDSPKPPPSSTASGVFTIERNADGVLVIGS